MKHHPDRGGDVEKMKTVTTAYSVLSDDEKKLSYDKQLYNQSQIDKKNKPNYAFSDETGVRLDDASMQKLAKLAGIVEPPPRPNQPPPKNKSQDPGGTARQDKNEFERKMENMMQFFERQNELVLRLRKIAFDRMAQGNSKAADTFFGHMNKVAQAKSFDEIKDLYDFFVVKGEG
jgi:curved DNA-binding protein CbpA